MGMNSRRLLGISLLCFFLAGIAPTAFASELYRISSSSKNVKTADLRQLVSNLGGKKALDKELGEAWYGRPYFHFTIPKAQLNSLLSYLKKNGQILISQEESTWTIPENSVRVILWLNTRGSMVADLVLSKPGLLRPHSKTQSKLTVNDLFVGLKSSPVTINSRQVFAGDYLQIISPRLQEILLPKGPGLSIEVAPQLGAKKLVTDETGFYRLSKDEIFQKLKKWSEIGIVHVTPGQDFQDNREVLDVTVSFERWNTDLIQAVAPETKIMTVAEQKEEKEVERQIKLKYAFELFGAGSLLQSKTGTVTILDAFAQAWVNQAGFRYGYLETYNATSDLRFKNQEYAALYRWPRGNNRYGQNIGAGVHFKDMRTDVSDGQIGGFGLSYADDMWLGVDRWVVSVLPFLDMPKTVEISGQYYFFAPNSDVESIQANAFSTRVFFHLNEKARILAGLYTHTYTFTKKNAAKTGSLHLTADRFKKS